jgi:serine/threonine-protein phosphatase 6 regulatory subunit 3
MTFWRFGISSASPLDALLDREFKIEELFEEDDLLQECKTHNRKLIDYLTKEDTILKCLAFITDPALDTADNTRRYKYPFIACEIFCCEIWALCEAVASHPGLLSALFKSMDRDDSMSPLLANYFGRVATMLLQKKPTEILAFLRAKENVVDRFVHHLDSTPVMELLLKILQSDSQQAGTTTWLYKAGLIPKLIAQLAPTGTNPDMHTNVGLTLVEISHSMQPQNPNSEAILEEILSPHNIKTLLSYVLSENKSSLESGLGVIVELLRRTVVTHDSTAPPHPLIVEVVHNLDAFYNLIITPPSVPRMETTFGVLAPPFGSLRLKVLEFFVALIRTRHHIVDEKIIQLNLLTTCLDHFFNYKWNNFLHALIEQLVLAVLESDCKDLRANLFKQCKFLTRIEGAFDENSKALGDRASKKGLTLGYMGFVTRLANTLIKMGREGVTDIADALKQDPYWSNFEVGPLAEVNERDMRPIGGSKPRRDDDDDDDDDPVEATPTVTFNTSGFDQAGADDDDDDEGEEELHTPANQAWTQGVGGATAAMSKLSLST